ncbi:MAG: hypothetical protein FWE32_02330 [Oscillospiraceae bacterium]|nr:hypothetical protein [Oscillospiraceae bacterium]
MTTGSLFGKRIPPACEYCEFAGSAGNDQLRACVKKGIVHRSFSCRHYRYDPIARVPRRPLALEKFDADDFTL